MLDQEEKSEVGVGDSVLIPGEQRMENEASCVNEQLNHADSATDSNEEGQYCCNQELQQVAGRGGHHNQSNALYHCDHPASCVTARASTKPTKSTIDRDVVQNDGTAAEIDDPLAEESVSKTPKKKQQRTSTRGQQLSAVMARIYVDKLVAFSPIKENWLKSKKHYGDAGSVYIVGRVTRFNKKKGMMEIQWLDTQFQKQDEYVGVSVVQRGMENYSNIMKSPSKPAWRSLCQADVSEVQIQEDASDIEEVSDDSEYRCYEPVVELPATMREVETITNMKFDPCAQIESPVLNQTNTAMRAYENENRLSPRPLFTPQEPMTFLGIMWFMKLVDRGEYANYWGTQIEDRLLGGNSVGLDRVMPLARFKLLRKSFCFRAKVKSTSSSAPSAAMIDVATQPSGDENSRNAAGDSHSGTSSDFTEGHAVPNP
ncbi:hypothetical protein ON010_g11571 [Phytophthora cinnamomi]|nr:hypothetical protein ON010_g11571 [Phytophthora cinnamomi]